MTLLLYSEVQADHVHVWGSCMGRVGVPVQRGTEGSLYGEAKCIIGIMVTCVTLVSWDPQTE